MTLENKKKYLVVFSLITILDQLTKVIITNVLDKNPFKVIPLIEGFCRLRYVENRGAVWGIFSDAGHTIIPRIITGLSIIAIIVVLYYFLKIEAHCVMELTSLSFIIGGAVGNIADRISPGYVIDFIEVYIKDYSWPTFNVSDSFITMGVILLIISIWRGKCTQF